MENEETKQTPRECFARVLLSKFDDEVTNELPGGSYEKNRRVSSPVPALQIGWQFPKILVSESRPFSVQFLLSGVPPVVGFAMLRTDLDTLLSMGPSTAVRLSTPVRFALCFPGFLFVYWRRFLWRLAVLRSGCRPKRLVRETRPKRE